jgi:hypothetical protein
MQVPQSRPFGALENDHIVEDQPASTNPALVVKKGVVPS